MDIINNKPVKESGMAEVQIFKLKPTIEDFRTDAIKAQFEAWFNWPVSEYAPDFIIIHPSLEPFVKPYVNESVDLIVDKKNEFHLSARIAIMGQYDDGSRSIDGDAPDS